MLFKKSESRIKPNETEAITGDRYLVRKNIRTEERSDTDGNAVTMYVYDEAVMTEAEFSSYSAVQQVEAKRETDIIDEYTLVLIEEGVL